MKFEGKLGQRGIHLEGDLLTITVEEAQADETYEFNLRGAVASRPLPIRQAVRDVILVVGNHVSRDDFAVALYARDGKCKPRGDRDNLLEFQPGGYRQLNLYSKGISCGKEIRERRPRL